MNINLIVFSIKNCATFIPQCIPHYLNACVMTVVNPFIHNRLFPDPSLGWPLNRENTSYRMKYYFSDDIREVVFGFECVPSLDGFTDAGLATASLR